MADQIATIGPPLGGLNLDTSPSQIDQDESPELYNFLLHEPGQMRRRNGWKARQAMGTSITAGSIPLNIMPCRNRFLVGYVAGTSNWYPTYFESNPTGALPAGYARTNGTIRIWAINADTPTAWTKTEIVQNGTTLHTDMMPLTATVQYEYASFGASCKPIFRLDKANVGRTATRLIKWGGSTGAAGGDFATIANGSVSGTFTGTPPSTSIVDQFLWFATDVPPYQYSYQVKTHTAGGAAFTLYKPYGLGETTTNVPSKTAIACTWSPMHVVVNSPIWCQCVAVHYDRLFVGRIVLTSPVGSIAQGEYPNGIMWSNPGEPEKWNDTSLILIDDRPDDAIMGFGHFGRNLGILRRESVYMMTGYSEPTFTVAPLTKEFGCIDSRSIVQFGDGVAFMSRDGMKYIDGSGSISDLSQRQPGHGVRNGMLTQISSLNGSYSNKQHLTSSAALCQGHLIAVNQYNIDTGSVKNSPWMMNLKTGAWANWGNDQADVYPYVFSPANQYINGRVVGLFNNFICEFDNMFLPENLFTATADSTDQVWSVSDAFTEPYIPVIARTKDFRLWDGGTARIRAMYVEHCIQTNTPGGGFTGLRLDLDTDRDLHESATLVGTVEPQYEDAGFPRYEAYYIREFRTGNFQKEAALFRLKLSQSAVSGPFPLTLKWFNVRVVAEPTNAGRVQNLVLS